MRILICEDEIPAAKQLEKLIAKVRPDAKIIGTVETGKAAKKWIKQKQPDLIFMDIELADGPCFETLDNVKVDPPVIFTTAYDHYAVDAFTLNSIDYLVKPISEKDIQKAFAKLDDITRSLHPNTGFIFSQELFETPDYKTRFLVKKGQKLVPVVTEEVAYFRAHDKMVWLHTKSNEKYIIDYSLTELEELLNPDHFFRINRQYLANHDAIVELESYFKGQVVVKLVPRVDEQIVVSRNVTPDLKDWLQK